SAWQHGRMPWNRRRVSHCALGSRRKRKRAMTARRKFYLSTAAAIGWAAFFGMSENTQAQQPAAAAVSIDSDDIGGVVTGPNGPEAGVWVSAETTDLPTKFSKVVVTDD